MSFPRPDLMGWLGTLAYCTYLIHLPLMEASRRVLERGLGYSSSSRSSLAAWSE
jgi:peptidoglycan/LPS O-acetylase OafA/YrhL